VGSGARRTVVDGTGTTRVFANFTAATMTGLTITGGCQISARSADDTSRWQT
jgi:hypothetical protein